jgi:hypothetical protein
VIFCVLYLPIYHLSSPSLLIAIRNVIAPHSLFASDQNVSRSIWSTWEVVLIFHLLASVQTWVVARPHSNHFIEIEPFFCPAVLAGEDFVKTLSVIGCQWTPMEEAAKSDAAKR